MDCHGDGAMSAAAGKLFRAEALHAQQQRWLGELRLVTPLSARVLVAGTVLIVAVLAVFASLGTYTRRVHATGMLAPATGLLTLAAPAAGRVQRIAIREGAPVAAGQVLAVVSSERQSLAGDTSSAVRLIKRRDIGCRLIWPAFGRTLLPQGIPDGLFPRLVELDALRFWARFILLLLACHWLLASGRIG
jgi:hypothetical protein